MGTRANLSFHGAAGSVTGSRFLLDLPDRRVLVDCGLFQGLRELRRLNWEPFPVPPATIDDVVLTHCHLDHTGYLPALVRDGFAGPVHLTPATAQLAEIVLRDSAHLAERDAEYAREGGWSRHDPPLPLYTSADVEATLPRLRPVAFGSPTALGPGARFTLSRAGHVLGSASVLIETDGVSVLFSGDLGRPAHPVIRPRDTPPAARTVVIESTYGARTHPAPTDPAHEEFADAIRRTVARGGSVLVPAFAVDRTALVLQALARMTAEGRIPRVPVYVDSPMALAVLEVYGNAALRGELLAGAHPERVDLPLLHLARTPEESMALNNPRVPSVIISASGMASGGRVVHHLRHLVPDRRNTVVLTGYQAAGTRGRALLDGAAELKMHGRYVPVRAEVVSDTAFSVHADADEILSWLGAVPEPPVMVYVVHGEPESSAALAARVRAELGWRAVVPRRGERVRLE